MLTVNKEGTILLITDYSEETARPVHRWEMLPSFRSLHSAGLYASALLCLSADCED